MTYVLPAAATEWIDAYRTRLNESDAFASAAAGWGVDFDGSFRFDVLPDDSYDGPTLSFFIDVVDGNCVRASHLDAPREQNAAFRFYGPATQWKQLLTGDLDPVEGRREEIFELDGDIQKVLQYATAIQLLTETAAEIDTTFDY